LCSCAASKEFFLKQKAGEGAAALFTSGACAARKEFFLTRLPVQILPGLKKTAAAVAASLQAQEVYLMCSALSRSILFASPSF
jgi:hypothetical protein